MDGNTTFLPTGNDTSGGHLFTSGTLATESGDWYHQIVDDLASRKIFGIPEDILLVLLIDAVLIALRLSNLLNPSQFIGAKIVGTSFLIMGHFL